MKYKTINNINFKNKKALIRVDYNVPLGSDLEVLDDTRVKSSVPTINKIINDGGSCILMSHMGRPKGKKETKFSLIKIKSLLENLLSKKIIFCDDCISNKTVEKCDKSKPGDVILLENVRFYKEEKLGDKNFSKRLSRLGDVYVNDAFGTAHRNHASNSVISKFFSEKCIGYLIEKEIVNINKIFLSKLNPFTAILGGSKVSDKIELIEKLINYVDNIIIGGAMSNTFIKAKGGNIGNSIYENDKLEVAKQLIDKSIKNKVKLYLPEDCLASKSINNRSETVIVNSGKIENKWINVDLGPKSIKKFHEIIMKSDMIIWNGPLGIYEISKFSKGTNSIAHSISNSTKNGAYSLVGGGDSISIINKEKLNQNISFISTGGGAMLDYIINKDLIAINDII